MLRKDEEALSGADGTKFVWVCLLQLSSPVVQSVLLGWGSLIVKLSSFLRTLFRQIRGAPKKPLPAYAVFQVPTAQNNRYTKVAYWGCHA